MMKSEEFERDVHQFITEQLQNNPDSTVTCQSLTGQFLEEHVRRYGRLGNWNVAAYIGVAQTIRPILRKRFNPDPIPETPQTEFPELQLLQDRYSVPRAGGDGEPAYVPRHMLTELQMRMIVARDRKISVHYAKRADALESWWNRHVARQTA